MQRLPQMSLEENNIYTHGYLRRSRIHMGDMGNGRDPIHIFAIQLRAGKIYFFTLSVAGFW